MKPITKYLSIAILLPLLFSACKENPSRENEVMDYNWYFLGFPNTRIWALELSDNKLYAGVPNRGLWRLNLNSPEIKWDSLGLADGTIDDILIDKGLNTIFVGVAGGNGQYGIWKTTNEGQSWIPSSDGIPAPSTAIHTFRLAQNPSNPDIMFANCDWRGLYKSTNRGNSWIEIYSFGTYGISIEDIEFLNHKGDTIWIGGINGLGLSFIVASEDGMNTWYWKSIRGMAHTYIVYDIEADPRSSSIVYISAHPYLFKTTNYGKSVDTLLTPVYVQGYHSSAEISINPNNPQEIICSGAYIYYSKNGGKNFEKIELPMQNAVSHSLAVDWQRRTLYVAIPDHGIYKRKF